MDELNLEQLDLEESGANRAIARHVLKSALSLRDVDQVYYPLPQDLDLDELGLICNAAADLLDEQEFDQWKFVGLHKFEILTLLFLYDHFGSLQALYQALFQDDHRLAFSMTNLDAASLSAAEEELQVIPIDLIETLPGSVMHALKAISEAAIEESQVKISRALLKRLSAFAEQLNTPGNGPGQITICCPVFKLAQADTFNAMANIQPTDFAFTWDAERGDWILYLDPDQIEQVDV